MQDSLLLISSTLPHFGAVFFFPHLPYQLTVAVSTLCSITWHSTGDPIFSPLGILDYSAATAWFLADCLYSYKSPAALYSIVVFNLCSAFLNSHLTEIHPVYGHSVWHLINCLKSYWVAYLLNKINY